MVEFVSIFAFKKHFRGITIIIFLFLVYIFHSFLKSYCFLAGSSWYLLCEGCREKYAKTNRGSKQQPGKFSAEMQKKELFIKPPVSPSANDHAIHLVMKNNAMFLLELASSSDSGNRLIVNYIQSL